MKLHCFVNDTVSVPANEDTKTPNPQPLHPLCSNSFGTTDHCFHSRMYIYIYRYLQETQQFLAPLVSQTFSVCLKSPFRPNSEKLLPPHMPHGQVTCTCIRTQQKFSPPKWMDAPRASLSSGSDGSIALPKAAEEHIAESLIARIRRA